MTRRRRWLVVGITAAFVCGGLVAESLAWKTGLKLGAIIDLLAGWVLAGAGLVAWLGSPRSRVGPLLLASAAGWFIGTLAVPTTAFGRSDLGWLAAFLVQCHAGFLVHAVATWPSGRVTRPTQLAIVAGGYVASLFPQVWYQEPGYIVLGVLLATGVFIDHRALTPARRAAYRPARNAGLLLAGGLVFIPAISRAMADLGWAVLATGATLWAITVALVGVLVAVALIQRERGEVVMDLAVELQDSWAPGSGDEFERFLREATAAETSGDPELRTALARADGLAQRNRDLRHALAARVEELEASRRRLVAVGDEELRGLEERLRSGAGARLESLEQAVWTLLEAGSEEPFGAPIVLQRLARTAEQLAAAQAELDALALGLDPGRVTERGLGAALRDLATTSPVPVELTIMVPRVADASVATTLYYVASEALANVVRHARARTAWLLLRESAGDWLLVVEDDGQGGADVGGGTGLRGLRERVEALGGTLMVGRRPGGGTRLQATVPMTASGGDPMRRLDGSFRLVVALAGLLIAAGGAVAVLAPGLDAVVTTPGATDPAVAWMLLATAFSLTVAGVVAWVARPGAVSSLIAFCAAAAWLAPELAGSPSVTREVRSLGLLLAPFVVPLLVHLPIRTLRADRGPTGIAIIALYTTMAVVAFGRVLTWDPFMTIDCLPVCSRGDNVLGRFVDIPLSLALRAAGWWLAAVAGGGLVAWAAVRLARSRRAWPSDATVLVPALATGLAFVGWATARLAVNRPSPTGVWSVRAEVLLAGAVVALGAGVAWARFREGERVAGARRLVELLDAAAGSRSLGETLATALRDPSVLVAYPIDGARGHVDDQGREVAAPASGRGRSVTSIERAGTVVALVEHDAGLDPDLLSREIGAAARLAVDNERLAAILRAQVRELQASRQQIVTMGDAARGRLERNLHDGAQQRLLAVSYELRLAQAAATDETPERRAAIDVAAGEIDRALAELRDLAHGIWPATLAEAGLDAALASLADEAPIPVALTDVPEERFPAQAEAAAYLAVAEALRRAVAASARRMLVRAQLVSETLRLEVRLPEVVQPGPWLRVDDRVGAAGGRTEVTVDHATGTLLVVELPCA